MTFDLSWGSANIDAGFFTRIRSLANHEGVLVSQIDPDSAAAQAGLERGDVILEVKRQAVTTVDQLNRYINNSKTESTLLFVSRDGRTQYIVISSK